MANTDTEKPTLLLHCCCGPCSTAVYERLQKDYEVICYWFNPNIQPDDEYDRRLESMKVAAEELGCELIVEKGGEEEWQSAIAGLEDEPEGGRRCDVCFRVRLEHAARKARELGCDFFTTTLTVSPHKPPQKVNPRGEEASKGRNVEYLAGDFKKQDGFKRSVELSKQMNLYRQDYCGCLYSKRDRNE
ncbi:MAG: epoxyqueuosine reductase QueH [Armatimonadota bacterium]